MTSSMRTSSRRVLVFLRAPRPGRVKTRLEPFLSRPDVAVLYRAFVEDLLATLDAGAVPMEIRFCPADAKAEVRRWLGPDRLYRAQSGEDLGQRMARAFAAAFSRGIDQALIVGSDLPDLPGERIHQAFSRLESTDAVVGPGTDGGYYLIGFRARGFVPELFSGIDWGQERVLAQTLAKAAEFGIACSLLPPWSDVDEPDDLRALARRLRTDPAVAPRTADFLLRKGMLEETVVKPDGLCFDRKSWSDRQRKDST